MKTKALILLAVLMISFNALAWDGGDCAIEIRNLSETETLNYWVWWVDHDIEDWPYPVNIMGGEIEPQDIKPSEYAYRPGLYIIQWQGTGECCGKNSREFQIDFWVTKVIIGISEKEDSYMFLEIYGA